MSVSSVCFLLSFNGQMESLIKNNHADWQKLVRLFFYVDFIL